MKHRKVQPSTEERMFYGARKEEGRLISLSMRQAGKRVADGSASDQLLLHFIKLGSSLVELERQKLEQERALVEQKTKLLINQNAMGDEYQAVIDAIRGYRGGNEDL